MSLKDYFWPEDPKNTVKRTCCKACVSRQLDSVGATTTGVVEGSQAFKDSRGGFTVGTDGSQTMYGAVEIDSDEFQLQFTGISAVPGAWGNIFKPLNYPYI
ncbi:hypothetical protein FB451DRAFT_1189515 [Mycena latifolia]|nr:hypothetical protein FB451DRAFT_1189515 [Mycena latifolia]